jgi:hypothetical protein
VTLGSKKEVPAEIVGRNLTHYVIEPEDCWRAVCMLRSYDTPGPIATCEMSFARAALVRSLLAEVTTDEGINARLVSASDRLIRDTFDGQDSSRDTDAFYHESLANAAPKRVQFYSEHVFPRTQLGAILGGQLGVPGHPAIEIGSLFENVVQRVEKLLGQIKVV